MIHHSLLFTAFICVGHFLPTSHVLADGLSEREADEAEIVDEFYVAYDAYHAARSDYQQLLWELRESHRELILNQEGRPTRQEIRKLNDLHREAHAEQYAELKVLAAEQALFRQRAYDALSKYNEVESLKSTISVNEREQDIMSMLTSGIPRSEIHAAVLELENEIRVLSGMDEIIEEHVSD